MLTKNVAIISIQTIVSMVSTFIFYRITIQTASIEVLGLWALVGAFLAFSKLIEFGVPVALVRYIAETVAKKENVNSSVITFSILILLGLTLFYIFGLVIYAINFQIDLIDKIRLQTDATLFFSLLTFYCLGLMLSNILGAVLDGYNLYYKRAFTGILGSIGLLLSSVALIPMFGLTGIAASFAIQYLIVILISIKYLNELPEYIWFGSLPLSGEIKKFFLYSLKFYSLSITAIGYEPLIKMLLFNFGGSLSVGIFEITFRLYSVARNFVVNGANTLLAKFSNTDTSLDSSLMKQGFRRSVKIANSFAIYIFSIALIGFPIYQQIINIDHYDSINYYCVAISVGLLINTLSAVAYVRSMASTDLKDLLKTQYGLIVGIACTGVIGGWFLGGIGVVLGAMISLAIVSALNSQFHHQFIGRDLVASFFGKSNAIPKFPLRIFFAYCIYMISCPTLIFSVPIQVSISIFLTGAIAIEFCFQYRYLIREFLANHRLR